MSEYVETGRARRFWKRLGLAAVVLAVGLGGVGYGVLIHARRMFPYALLKRGLHVFERHRPHLHQRHVHGVAGKGQASPEDVRRLANIPYLQGYQPATDSGVIRVYDPSACQKGWNFFTSGHGPVATLMDMDGKVVKTWSVDPEKAFAGPIEKHHSHEHFMRDASLMPDGGIVAMFDQIGLVRLDSDSHLLWAWRAPVHHDLVIDDTGTIWTLLHEKHPVRGMHHEEPVLVDYLVELSSQGQVLRRVSLAECFQRSRFSPLLSNAPPDKEDVFHSNSVAVLDGSLASRSAAFRRGNLLVSIKALNTIAVVDPDAAQVVWALTGQWYGQHSASLLPSGHLLLFDNLGSMRLASRVLEIDPFTQEVLWSFGGHVSGTKDLLSETVGWAERLANGNTLISESNYGRALEVTSGGKVVWEFVNPNRVGKTKQLVAVIYFMHRVPAELPFLKQPSVGTSSAPRHAAGP